MPALSRKRSPRWLSSMVLFLAAAGLGGVWLIGVRSGRGSMDAEKEKLPPAPTMHRQQGVGPGVLLDDRRTLVGAPGTGEGVAREKEDLSREDIPALRKKLLAMSAEELSSEATRRLLLAWASREPAQAYLFLGERGDWPEGILNALRGDLLEQHWRENEEDFLYFIWGNQARWKSSPADAYAIATTLGKGDLLTLGAFAESVLPGEIYGILGKGMEGANAADLQRLGAWLLEPDRSAGAKQASATLAAAWAAQDAPKALRWIEQLSDGPTRRAATVEIFRGMAKSSPEMAAGLFADPTYWRRIAGQMGETDAGAKLRQEALRLFLFSLVQTNPELAETYSKTLR